MGPGVCPYLIFIPGSLGALGAGVFIGTYIFVPSLRTVPRSFLFYLSITDFFQSMIVPLWCIMPLDKAAHMCNSIGLIRHYSLLASAAWTTCISVYVFYRVHSPAVKVKTYSIIIFHIMAWGIPASIILLCMLVTKLETGEFSFSYNGKCMTAKSADDRYGFRYMLNYRLPLLLSFVVMATMYRLARAKVLEIKHNLGSVVLPTHHFLYGGDLEDVVTKFTLLPIVFFICRLAGNIQAILHAVYEYNCPTCDFIAISLDTMQGFVNCTIFVFLNHFVRDAIRARFCKPKVPHSILNHDTSDYLMSDSYISMDLSYLDRLKLNNSLMTLPPAYNMGDR
eukprot:NODE_3770_length_1291_cov_94.115582_g3300_i0.p1 GENE.NODE_3770_length_1291_cov_94.115582_g3300_i0~~NODE_3770_length_1291_cov_94.115582_g3300_i0.p1  ORF type:complete len:337 (-),score=24.31 NODE_3770_length_1291_cov_94.115582_g3300_i0:113-1123(-)